MNFVSKIGDVVLLDNDESLVVVDCVEYKDEAYLKLGSLLFEKDNEQYVTGFVKEVIDDDGTYKISLVNDLELIETLENIIKEVRKSIE